MTVALSLNNSVQMPAPGFGRGYPGAAVDLAAGCPAGRSGDATQPSANRRLMT